MRLVLSMAMITCFSLLYSSCKENSAETLSHDVNIVTEDNLTLRGTLYSANRPGPGILLLHMCIPDAGRGTWSSLANMLAKEGFHILTFDFRGYGQSEGEWPDFETMPEFIEVCRTTIMKDVEAAYEYLSSQVGVSQDRMGIAGASCGVFMGIQTGLNHPEVRALALLSGPFDEQARQQLESLDMVPVLSAASQDDVRAFEAMKRVFSASKHPNSTLIQYKGAEHGTNMFAKEPDLQRTVVEWFKRWL